jgi:hypothetical protein
MRIPRPSPALGVSLLALFVALGGTSYAAVSLVPANSVGTRQIQDDSVTRSKIAHESITSTLVKNGSLYAVDFAANSLPVGPTGPAGPKGDKGDTGSTGATGAISQITVRANAVVVPAGGVGVVTASCTSDERASGGGSSWSLASGESGAGLSTVALTPAYDSYGATAYVGRGQNATASAHTFTVSALCYHR